MAVSLKNRQVQIPNGFAFRIPEIGFIAPPYQSFDVLVNTVLRVVTANSQLARKYHWPLDKAGVEMWVDRVNADICLRNGWKDYINISQTNNPQFSDFPKVSAPETVKRLQAVAGAVRKINSGVKLLLDWEKSGEPPAMTGVAEHRASICETCPKNAKGGLTQWFTVPASEAIRSRISRLRDLNLTTNRDEKLNICQACLCPLKLKVWTPKRLIDEHLTDEVKKELPSFCWMLE